MFDIITFKLQSMIDFVSFIFLTIIYNNDVIVIRGIIVLY